jgi:hypothetical protein
LGDACTASGTARPVYVLGNETSLVTAFNNGKALYNESTLQTLFNGGGLYWKQTTGVGGSAIIVSSLGVMSTFSSC